MTSVCHYFESYNAESPVGLHTKTLGDCLRRWRRCILRAWHAHMNFLWWHWTHDHEIALWIAARRVLAFHTCGSRPELPITLISTHTSDVQRQRDSEDYMTNHLTWHRLSCTTKRSVYRPASWTDAARMWPLQHDGLVTFILRCFEQVQLSTVWRLLGLPCVP